MPWKKLEGIHYVIPLNMDDTCRAVRGIGTDGIEKKQAEVYHGILGLRRSGQER